jgi:hypothetical protein
MKRMSRLIPVLLALLAVAGWLVSCNKKDSPTTPAGVTTGGGELSGNLSAGNHYAHTFTAAGTFNYHCSLHPGCSSLAGTIVVIPVSGTILHRVLAISQSGGSAGGGVYGGGATCSSLSLQRDTVFVGDVVTWTNSSPLPHTVVSQ